MGTRETNCFYSKVFLKKNTKIGAKGDSNPRPLAPKARIIPLDHWPNNEPRGIRTPSLRVWNPTRCHCAMGSRQYCKWFEYCQCFSLLKHLSFSEEKKKPAVGVEPTTPSLRSLCNNHYATRARLAGGEIRTRDPLLTRQMQ